MMSEGLDNTVARLKAMLVNYGQTAAPRLLDQAIDLSNHIIQNRGFANLTPDVAAATWSLGGAARIHRSRLGDHPGDLDEAIAWCRRALDAASETDSNRAAYACNLASILVDRYDRDKNRPDLDEGLGLFEWAVPAVRAAGSNAAVALHNQGMALLDMYEADHDLGVLDRAITALRSASADTTQPQPVAGGYLNTLGQALRAKAAAVSDPAILDESVQVLRHARDWTAGSDDHVAALVSLGNSLLDRSEIAGGMDDLDESVSCLDAALGLVTPGTSRWGHLASNLGNALLAFFRASGRPAPLHRACGLFRDAARTFADSSPDQDICLSNLAVCLQELQEQTGELSFLDEAIDVYRAIVDRSPNADRLHNFGVTLLARFKRYQSPGDLQEAIAQFQAAARASPPSSVIHAAATNSLGNALFLRFDLLMQDTDLDAAVRAHEEAVRSARESSTDRAMYRANLGVTLMARGQKSDSPADIEAAVREQEAAAAVVPPASQEYVRVLAGLADSLAARSALTDGSGDGDRAKAAYRAAIAAALERLPEQAIGSADSWGSWAISREAFREAAEAYGYGLQAVEQLFRTQLTRAHKESWLRDAQYMPVLAAYARAKGDDVLGAVEDLERGRAQLLSEALQRDRTSMERLADTGRPDLKDRYEAAAWRWIQLTAMSSQPE
jgi:tetratricopeptide (TPR) repeat protein